MIQGFDMVTGKLRWAWDMMHPDWNGYPPAGQYWSRGTPNSWTGASGDEQLAGLCADGQCRERLSEQPSQPQENQYATSLVALDVRTGKRRWTFQAVKKDVWDYDFGSQATLIDYKGTPAIVVPTSRATCTCWTGRPAGR